MTEAEKAVNRVMRKAEEKARQATMDGLREAITQIARAEEDEIANLGILALEAEMWADDSSEGSMLRSEMLSAARDYRARQNQLIAEREARNWKPYPHQNIVYQPAISRGLLRSAGIIALGAAAITLLIVFHAQIVEFLWGSMQ